MSNKKFKKDTITLHGGQNPDSETGARVTPIYQTTSYTFRDTKHAADLFEYNEEGNIYTRLMNPTTDVFENRMAQLEGGKAALATSSGMAAISLTILNFTKVGDEILSLDNLYGGTYSFFRHTLKKLGRHVNFIPSNASKEDIEDKITSKTKAIYAETIGNPKLDICNFEMLADIAHSFNIPFIVDNTCGIYLTQPIKYGADIIASSATKFIGGHGNSIGGVIVDSGKFDWESGDFSEITEPDESNHGLRYIDKFGDIAFVKKARIHLLRDLGQCLSPFNAFLFLQGLETLHLRMPKHCENALKVAKHLQDHPKISWVNYPGLKNHPSFRLAKKYLKNGSGALLGFGVKGGRKAGAKFIESVKLLSHLANIGDAKTLVIHPATTTHQQLTKEEQKSTGVTDDYIRISVGLEDPDDIISDIDQALEKI